MHPSMQAAVAITPSIIAARQEIEQKRRIPVALNKKMVDAGLFRMLVPMDIGGLEVEPWQYVEALEVLAEADASAAWCTMIAASTCLKSAFLDRDIAANIYGPKDVVHGGVFAPNGRADIDGDDFIINGTWQWASGSPNCTWLTGGAVVYEDGEMQRLPNGGPNARQTLFPASEATLGDDWYVNGLCGTSSGSMTVENVRIPQKHSVSLTMDKQKFGGPLYVFPSFGLLALGIATVALGNAKGAIADLVELADGKTPEGARKVLAQRVHSQIELAQATAALRGARAYLEDSVGQAWNEARNIGKISTEARCHIRLACTHGTKTAADVSRVMYELGGGTSLFLASPLQRRFRDAYAATQHMMVAPPTLELTGRILMGVDTDLTFL